MSSGWNEPPPRLDANFRSRIKQRTTEYLTQVNWKSNCEPKNLQDAIAQAKAGNDGGLELTMTFRPTGYDFHEWMDWSSLVTYLFNRDTPYARILSALRKANFIGRNSK